MIQHALWDTYWKVSSEICQNRVWMAPSQQYSLDPNLSSYQVSFSTKKSRKVYISNCLSQRTTLDLAYPKTYMKEFSSLFRHIFQVKINIFCFNQFQFYTLVQFLNFDRQKGIRMAWKSYKFWGMLNLLVVVLSLYDKQFPRYQGVVKKSKMG